MKELLSRFIPSFFYVLGLVMGILCAFGCVIFLFAADALFVIFCGLGVALGAGLVITLEPYLPRF